MQARKSNTNLHQPTCTTLSLMVNSSQLQLPSTNLGNFRDQMVRLLEMEDYMVNVSH